MYAQNIKKWATPQLVSDTIANFPSKNYIYPDPYGVCLVIGAWNYPLQLTLAPIIGAMAAGNTCIIRSFGIHGLSPLAKLNVLYCKNFVTIWSHDIVYRTFILPLTKVVQQSN